VCLLKIVKEICVLIKICCGKKIFNAFKDLKKDLEKKFLTRGLLIFLFTELLIFKVQKVKLSHFSKPNVAAKGTVEMFGW
jgi:hypothetical protein